MKQDTVKKLFKSIRRGMIIDAIFFGTIIGAIQYSKAQVPHNHTYGKATVYLDHYGVSHLYGPTDASVIYASAWVEANANWKLVEQNFLRSIGRASEVFGQKTIGDDYLDRALQIPELSMKEYKRESPKLSNWSAGQRYGISGNSFVKVIDFGPQIRSRSVIEFGQSADPKSPHFFDQAPLYAKEMFKKAWFYRKDVEKHIEQSYQVGVRHDSH